MQLLLRGHLAADFSNVSNPNGPWSFTQGATNLTHFPAASVGNAIDVVATNGYWALSSTLDYNSTLFQVTGNGSTAPGYNDNDFLAGDVVVHTTNPGTGSAMIILWTAPANGTISYSGRVWYAHSIVVRSTDYFLTLNGGPNLASGSVATGEHRSNADTFVSGGLIAVNGGDVLELRFSPTAGRQFGSLTGTNLTIDFTAGAVGIPEPGTCGLLAGGLIGLLLKRRNMLRTV